jgi:hypothetical protein
MNFKRYVFHRNLLVVKDCTKSNMTSIFDERGYVPTTRYEACAHYTILLLDRPLARSSK